MKVLTVNCVYDQGSTGKIIKDIEKHLSDKCEFVFCYESGPKSNGNMYRIADKYTHKFYYLLARLTGLKYSTGYTTTFRLIRFIKKQVPDIVHLHCPNISTVNIPWLISFLKQNQIPTVITNHAEFYYTGNCPHAFECMKFTTGCGNCDYVFDPYRKFLFDRTAYEWKRMKKAFDGFNNVVSVSVSPWVMSRQQMSPVMKGIKSVVVKNGIDTDNIFHPRKTDLKSQLNIPDGQKVVLHVTASFSDREEDIKGGHYIIKLAAKMPDIVFLVVGSSLLNDNSKIPTNVKIIGRVSDQSLLAEYYSIADITVLTSRRETYGMSVAESLCCGTPVVAFKAGGPESIALDEYSSFVEYGNIDALEQSVNEMLDMKSRLTFELSEKACQLYSSQTMANEYYEVYKGLYKLLN
ncbi:MAG: glycosyltransferase [Clostridia bacterium]|nr:glycosyltransferase [Clostridia bacterium]